MKSDIDANISYFYMSTPVKDQGILIFGMTSIFLVTVSNSNDSAIVSYNSSGREITLEDIAGKPRIKKVIVPRWERPTVIGEVTIHPFEEIEGGK